MAGAVGEMLKALGHVARRACDADEALRDLTESAAYDVILSDMVMPGQLDGIGLAREVRQRGLPLPILLTTGYSEAAEQAVKEGLIPLAKPYSIETLAARLEETVQQGVRKSA